MFFWNTQLTDDFFGGFYSFFRRTSETDEKLKDLAETGELNDEYSRIRCPLCDWKPSKNSRWCCADSLFPENFYGGCYTSWNTFDTRGLCPGCHHQWRYTFCLACHQHSLHEDWYV